MLRDYLRNMCGFNVNVRLFLVQTFIAGIYSGIYGVVFNLYVLHLGFDTGFLGLLLSTSLLASALASIPAGMLCDRYNHKAILVIFGLLSLLAVLPLFLSSSPPVLLLASAVSGIFGQITLVCATPFLTENCEKGGMTHVFSASSALAWGASVIGYIAGGVLPYLWPALRISGDKYRLTMLASMALLLVGWTMLLFLKDNQHARPPQVRRPSLRLKPSPAVMKFTLITLIIGAGSGMIVPYFNVYFTRIVHASVFATGLVFAVASLFMVAGFVAIPWLSTRIGRARSAVFTQVASLPFLLLMAVTGNFLIASVAYTMRMLLMNMAMPAMTSLQMETIRPGERGYAVGLISTGQSLSIAAATYVSGMLMAGGSYTLPFLVTCCSYVAAAGLLYYYFGHDERRQAGVLRKACEEIHNKNTTPVALHLAPSASRHPDATKD
jgi:MFS family permease